MIFRWQHKAKRLVTVNLVAILPQNVGGKARNWLIVHTQLASIVIIIFFSPVIEA